MGGIIGWILFWVMPFYSNFLEGPHCSINLSYDLFIIVDLLDPMEQMYFNNLFLIISDFTFINFSCFIVYIILMKNHHQCLHLHQFYVFIFDKYVHTSLSGKNTSLVRRKAFGSIPLLSWKSKNIEKYVQKNMKSKNIVTICCHA